MKVTINGVTLDVPEGFEVFLDEDGGVQLKPKPVQESDSSKDQVLLG